MTSWIDEFSPKNDFEFIGKFNNISIIQKWLKENSKKAMFVYGQSGVGKTELVSYILNKNNYNKIEINTGLIKNSIKSIKDYTKKIMDTNDISTYFCNKPKKTVIVIDELENLMLEKGILSEILLMLSSKIIEKIPIIIISNTIDKKVNEILKKCLSSKIEPPTSADMKKLIYNIVIKKNMDIETECIDLIIEKSECDFRRLINLMYEIYIQFGKNNINKNMIEEYIFSFGNKNVDMNLSEITSKIITSNLDTKNILNLYDTDKLLISLMIHENYIKQITGITSDINCIIKNIAKISYNISLSEMYEKQVYNNHSWELYNFSGLHSCVFTNFILNKLDNKQFRNIIFTNYLSKSSTFTSKRKIENYYYELLNIDTSIPFITVCDIIISYIFNKETYPKIISFLKSNKFKYDDFDKLYKHSSIKENFKKNYSTKFKKALKESLN